MSKKFAKSTAGATETTEEVKRSNHAQRVLDARKKGEKSFFRSALLRGCVLNILCADAKIEQLLETQFAAGRLYASVSSRPGQVGRCDGYILEGKELEVSLRPLPFFLCSPYVVAVLSKETQERQAEA